MSKYCNECNENIANGTMDCPSCGADLRGKAVRYWIDDTVEKESVKAMTYHELLDAMLNNHTVWFWDGDKLYSSAIYSIDREGIVHCACGADQADVSKLFATRLDLLRSNFDKIQNMLRTEEALAKRSSFEDGIDECEEDDN
jgi:hypothetical protein